MKRSFHTGFLTDLPVLDAVAMVMDHGYDEVELNAETLPWQQPHVTPGTDRATRTRLASAAAYSAISAHCAGLAAETRAERETSVLWTQGLIDLACDLECRLIHVIPGEHATTNDRLTESLETIVEHGARRGVVVAVEPIVEQLVGTTRQTLALLRAVPGLHVNLDPSHLQVMDGSIAPAAEQLVDHTEHVAIKDAAGAPGDWTFPRLGDGDVDFRLLLDSLRSAGYDGTLSIEHEAHVFARDQRSKSEVLTASREFVDHLIAEAQSPSPR